MSTLNNSPSHTDQSLPKAYKLCSLKKIETLYNHGSLIKVFPLRLTYFLEEPIDQKNEVCFEVLFSAPKKNFKNAHDRNYIKRLLREVLRKNKAPLEAHLLRIKKKLIFSITFVDNARPNYQILEKKLSKLLDVLIREITP